MNPSPVPANPVGLLIPGMSPVGLVLWGGIGYALGGGVGAVVGVVANLVIQNGINNVVAALPASTPPANWSPFGNTPLEGY